MRIGQPEKVRRGQKAPIRVDAIGKPQHASHGSVVGKLSPDYVSVYFGPELKGRAVEALEDYSARMMEYDDAVQTYQDALESLQRQKEENGGESVSAEAEIKPDGSIVDPNLPPLPTPPKPPLYRSEKWVKELDEVLADTSDYFQSKNGGWKAHARAARFERLMDERYGRLRPLIKQYPELEQMFRSVQRKYATGYFSPFRQGKPPIPKSTAVIILFMMQRGNLRWEITMFAVLFFLVGLQPWALVVVVAGIQALLDRRRRKPMKPMKPFIPLTEPYYTIPIVETDDDTNNDTTKSTSDNDNDDAETRRKVDLLKQSVGTKLGPNEKTETLASEYDTILLGHGPETLYLGALLSRAGRKVLVLSSRGDASGCYSMDGIDNEAITSIPFDIESSNVSKCSRQQQLLSPALCSTTDYQGGVRFAKIGEETDGYAFEILSVPGMGTERGEDGVPFVLRADGAKSLIEDAALTLGDGWPGVTPGDTGNSATAVYLNVCETLNGTSNQFYMSKMLDDSVNSLRNNSTYEEATVRYASAFLERGFPLNVHTRSLLAAIGMRGENIKPGRLSMGAHVTNVCSAMSGEGMHYPIGGPRALCHAFRAVIEENGGRILTNVPLWRLRFEKSNANPTTTENSTNKATETGSSDEKSPRCIGVQLTDKRIIEFDMNQWNKNYDPAVVSMVGLISTFIRLLPDEVRTAQAKVPRGLGALAERRPVMKILFALKGSAQDLNVTGADYYRLPSAAIAKDEMDQTSGQVKFGEIGGSSDAEGPDEVEVDAVNMDSGENPQSAETAVASTKSKRSKRVKYEAGKSWMQISFPSAKDPSFESRHGKVTSCVVTIEADDDFVTMFDTKPRLYAAQKGKGETHGDYIQLVQRVQQDLFDTYPQLKGKIVHSKMIGPIYRGLSHTPERYAAKGVRPSTPYPGLFVGGSDLTVGESFSGSIVGSWLAANAVMGYSALDHLFLQKNITTDITQFMDIPDIPDDDEDVAVAFRVDEPQVESKPDVSVEPELAQES